MKHKDNLLHLVAEVKELRDADRTNRAQILMNASEQLKQGIELADVIHDHISRVERLLLGLIEYFINQDVDDDHGELTKAKDSIPDADNIVNNNTINSTVNNKK